MYLKNAWYVAGWSKDFDRTLKAETFLGEEIVIYRREDGAPVALEDACPHRKLPLSKGNLKGDTVECGYHGLTFDCSGDDPQIVALNILNGDIPTAGFWILSATICGSSTICSIRATWPGSMSLPSPAPVPMISRLMLHEPSEA